MTPLTDAGHGDAASELEMPTYRSTVGKDLPPPPSKRYCAAVGGCMEACTNVAICNVAITMYRYDIAFQCTDPELASLGVQMCTTEVLDMSTWRLE